MRRAALGFTVLELMVALAIVAMMAAIAGPGMLQFIRANRLSAAARQFDADVTLARREAIKRNARVLICPTGSVAGKCGTATASAWTQGWLVCYDANSDGDCDDATADNPNPIKAHAALDPTLTLTGPAAVGRFNANGTQGAAGGGSLLFTLRGTWSGAKAWVEIVTPTGNITLASAN